MLKVKKIQQLITTIYYQQQIIVANCYYFYNRFYWVISHPSSLTSSLNLSPFLLFFFSHTMSRPHCAPPPFSSHCHGSWVAHHSLVVGLDFVLARCRKSTLVGGWIGFCCRHQYEWDLWGLPGCVVVGFHALIMLVFGQLGLVVVMWQVGGCGQVSAKLWFCCLLLISGLRFPPLKIELF